MKTDICIWVSPGDRSRLERLVSDRNTPQKHVWRARIVLLSGERLGTMAIMRQVGKSKPTVWRWRERFLEEGVEGLLRDRDRGSGRPPLGERVMALVLTKTMRETPPNATHWSVRAMARAVGISHTSVQRIWAGHGLKPHLVSTFKVSNDPRFAEKVEDIIGLYLNPPDKALVLSLDEKSQIQALDRTQPGLPMKKGRAGTMTHDYKRNGTTTLFAALNVLDGTVIGQCLKRHRHQEFLGFLRKLDRETPKRLDIHLIIDNYATHKHARVRKWLENHPRFHFHFTPTSASWLNQVERFFAEITRNAIRRGVFKSVSELEAAIDDYLVKHNEMSKPFAWTATARDTIEKVDRAREALNQVNAGTF
jgi:transposase